MPSDSTSVITKERKREDPRGASREKNLIRRRDFWAVTLTEIIRSAPLVCEILPFWGIPKSGSPISVALSDLYCLKIGNSYRQ
jgi:hypothetical protein